MTDDATTETTSSNFQDMGGAAAVPTAGGDIASRLDAQISRAAIAANSATADQAERLDTGVRDWGLAGLSMEEQLARLDDIAAEAELAANAERDLADDLSVLDEGSDDEVDEDASDLADDELAESEEGKGDAEPEQPEQPRYSRREAARLASELEQAKAQLATVEAAHRRILGHLGQQSGAVPEANGHPRYDNLQAKLLAGRATREEADEVRQMTEWREFAAPIFMAAQDHVSAAFASGYRRMIDSAIKTEKLEPATAERLWKSADPVLEAIKIGAEMATKRAARPKPPVQTSRAVPPSMSPRPDRPQRDTSPPLARVNQNRPSDPGWMGEVMANLEHTMSTSAAAANERARREQAELDHQVRRRRGAP